MTNFPPAAVSVSVPVSVPVSLEVMGLPPVSRSVELDDDGRLGAFPRRREELLCRHLADRSFDHLGAVLQRDELEPLWGVREAEGVPTALRRIDVDLHATPRSERSARERSLAREPWAPRAGEHQPAGTFGL